MAGSLTRFDLFAEQSAMQRQSFSEAILGSGRSMPTTDIYTEDGSELTVEAHLPGFASGDVAIDFEQDTLVIRAERQDREEDKSKTYLIRESASSYYRRILLPEKADEANVSASFTGGVLRVTVRYKAAETPRRTQIDTGRRADDDR